MTTRYIDHGRSSTLAGDNQVLALSSIKYPSSNRIGWSYSVLEDKSATFVTRFESGAYLAGMVAALRLSSNKS